MNRTNAGTAIVTGASRGIGAAVAARLAADGFNVVINYSSDPTPAEALARRLEHEGRRALCVKADVRDPLAVRYLFDAAESTFGGVDVLVNNAGVMAMKTIADTDDETFARQVDINLKGTFHALREAAGRLREGGRIVNFSSSTAGLRQPLYGVYIATKVAVEALTSVLAKELRGRSITVNAVAPGPTATELFFAGKSQEMVDRYVAMSPLERLGQPDDIAAAVSFLVGPDGAWVDGQTLRVNGGIV
ncbi:SDR family oxidoreductase [Nannocystis sp. SCPEA4]|uniref:SDR family oxidoreductase n=1 Tax=Nannocystis sp. SCPEA4 TaxID=2996787 RepID=UPI0022702743|nr:SDR family oxidoreductase [Nannocystis sp. SCPEA4]MCY1059894.1 SDR family oxidoreductase [Nannocystis sp. SCPEA4]